LPEGRTVGDLFRDAVTDALRSCGYRVTRDPDSGAAIPLTVRIDQFWVSQTYLDRHEGRVSVLYGIPATEYDVETTVSFEAAITGPLKPFENGQLFVQNSRGQNVWSATRTLAPAAIGTFRTEFRNRLRTAGATCGL
jgi:hypothetical protein